MSGDGTRTYIWNARNQLTQIKDGSGSVIASFRYDALGRRQGKTINGIVSNYLYDGANIVQERDGANAVVASYLGGGIDELFAQQTGTGASAQTSSYLTDALGSTIRLTDGNGGKLVDYTYDAYGNTTADAVVSNPFQFTGRENDGTGLYYYRARYYSPGCCVPRLRRIPGQTAAVRFGEESADFSISASYDFPPRATLAS